jgi:hypothetical protein
VWEVTDWIHLGLDRVVSSCEHGNEPLDSVRGGQFFDQLSDSQHLKKDPAQWYQFPLCRRKNEIHLYVSY